MKHDSGIKEQDDKPSGIEILMSETFAKINPRQYNITQIFTKTNEGKTIVFPSHPDTTIETIKNLIYDKTGIPPTHPEKICDITYPISSSPYYSEDIHTKITLSNFMVLLTGVMTQG